VPRIWPNRGSIRAGTDAVAALIFGSARSGTDLERWPQIGIRNCSVDRVRKEFTDHNVWFFHKADAEALELASNVVRTERF
jgi:hypothetical protein